MTVPSNLNPTRFSSIASAKATEKPSASTSPASAGGAAQTKGSATPPPPSIPAGLVGHHVNTTA
ncbi:MAG TPA: hypothetical protein VF573_24890 [Paraburkholderia sp.]|uniref:hypothetical protein n=1 Tax=Paraburkholderia sp. TaxID=1926495 RepID=UPI002ED5AD6B